MEARGHRTVWAAQRSLGASALLAASVHIWTRLLEGESERRWHAGVGGAGWGSNDVRGRVAGDGMSTCRRKVSSVAQSWSIWAARQNQASGSVSNGLPSAVPVRAVEASAELDHYCLRVGVAGVLDEVSELV